MMTHAEMTKHLRKRIAKAGIKARVRKSMSCGNAVIDVISPTFERTFSLEERQTIGLIAKVNGMTFARGLPIEGDVIGSPSQITFYMPVA